MVGVDGFWSIVDCAETAPGWFVRQLQMANGKWQDGKWQIFGMDGRLWVQPLSGLAVLNLKPKVETRRRL
jgi:hypothetical protein